MAPASGRRTVPGLTHHRPAVGCPLPGCGPRRYGRPFLTPAPQPPPDADAHGTADHQGPPPAALGTRPYRPLPQAGALHRPPRPYPLPDRPPDPPGSGQRPCHTPLRTRPPRRAGPHRHQEAGEHPRRRRPQGARPPGGPQDQVRGRLPVHPHRRRRPLPPGLQRDPARREEGNRHRLLAAGAGLLRQRRDHRRTGPDRQRRLLQVARLARRPRSSLDHPQANPALPAPDQRQGRTPQPHPARRVGLRPPLPVRTGTTRRLPRLAALLQSPPRTHRTRRQTTRQPRPQPHWAIHQGAAPEPSAASRRSALAWSSSAMSSQSGPKARRSSAASRNSAASSGFCRHAIR